MMMIKILADGPHFHGVGGKAAGGFTGIRFGILP
jgi:hypothetical protein